MNRRRPSHGPGVCRRDCLHAAMVADYRAARERDELAREAVAIGYPADEAMYPGRMVTFRTWLEQLAGQGLYTRQGAA